MFLRNPLVKFIWAISIILNVLLLVSCSEENQSPNAVALTADKSNVFLCVACTNFSSMNTIHLTNTSTNQNITSLNVQGLPIGVTVSGASTCSNISTANPLAVGQSCALILQKDASVINSVSTHTVTIHTQPSSNFEGLQLNLVPDAVYTINDNTSFSAAAVITSNRFQPLGIAITPNQSGQVRIRNTGTAPFTGTVVTISTPAPANASDLIITTDPACNNLQPNQVCFINFQVGQNASIPFLATLTFQVANAPNSQTLRLNVWPQITLGSAMVNFLTDVPYVVLGKSISSGKTSSSLLIANLTQFFGDDSNGSLLVSMQPITGISFGNLSGMLNSLFYRIGTVQLTGNASTGEIKFTLASGSSSNNSSFKIPLYVVDSVIRISPIVLNIKPTDNQQIQVFNSNNTGKNAVTGVQISNTINNVSIAATQTGTITPGNSETFSVTNNALTAGIYNVTISAQDLNTSGSTNPAYLVLNVVTPTVSLSIDSNPNELIFTNPGEKVVKVLNESLVPATLSGASIGGSNQGLSIISNTCIDNGTGITLAPNEACTIVIAADVTAQADPSTLLNVNINANPNPLTMLIKTTF